MKNQILSRIKRTVANRGVILMYHQIAALPCDPWQLAVHPEKFEAQLKVLQRHFDVVSLEELIFTVRNIPLHRHRIAITFDDGFRDNHHTAAPLLERYRLPASFYIATKLINSDDMFWWDTVQHLILYTKKLPPSLDIVIAGKPFHYELYEDALLTHRLTIDISRWNYERPILNKRVELYVKIWEQLKMLTMEDRDNSIRELKSWVGDSYPTPGVSAVMNVDELRTLGNNSLFTIGAHTVNHPALGTQTADQQIFEINQSKEVLQGWLNKKINSFAYPYGNYDTMTTSIINEAGFENAVTTEEKPVTRSSAILELPRYQIKDWTGKEFHQRISNWLIN